MDMLVIYLLDKLGALKVGGGQSLRRCACIQQQTITRRASRFGLTALISLVIITPPPPDPPPPCCHSGINLVEDDSNWMNKSGIACARMQSSQGRIR